MMVRRYALWVVIALLPAPLASAADRFAVAGITEAEARSMFETLQTALRSDDRETVAGLVEYPLRVNSAGTHRLISDHGQLLSDFASVFTSRIRQQVLAQQFNQLFVNWQGVMVANGALWFSGICDPASRAGTCKSTGVRIVAINQSPGILRSGLPNKPLQPTRQATPRG